MDPNKNVLREDFLEFVLISDLTGEGIPINQLETGGMDTKWFVDQGYDGASAMSESFNGAFRL